MRHVDVCLPDITASCPLAIRAGKRAAMRAAAVKCRTAAVDGEYAMVAVWKSDLVGSDIDPLHGVFGERAANRGWRPWFSAEP